MSSAEFETYCFLRLYSGDLNDCRHTLRIIRRYRKADVRFALIRDLAVTYSRPFSVNRGKVIQKHVLKLKHVPSAHRKMHDRLLELRNCQFAHSSLEFHNPKVAKLGNVFAMSRKSVGFEYLDQSLAEIEALIIAVETSVNDAVLVLQARL